MKGGVAIAGAEATRRCSRGCHKRNDKRWRGLWWYVCLGSAFLLLCLLAALSAYCSSSIACLRGCLFACLRVACLTPPPCSHADHAPTPTYSHPLSHTIPFPHPSPHFPTSPTHRHASSDGKQSPSTRADTTAQCTSSSSGCLVAQTSLSATCLGTWCGTPLRSLRCCPCRAM